MSQAQQTETPNTPAPAPAQGTGTAGGAPSWMEGFNDDLKGYVQSKGFKAPQDIVDSYRNLEKVMGAPKERILRLPEKEEDTQGWGEVYNRLGRPGKPEEYVIPKPATGDNDPNFEKFARELFFETGISRKQAEKIVGKFNEFTGGAVKQQQETYSQKIAQEEAGLKREWGNTFEQNKEYAKKAASRLGMLPEQIDAMEQSMGFAGAYKFLHSLGVKMGEAEFVSGDKKTTGFSGMTPEMAKTKINNDTDLRRRYSIGEKDAGAEMARLHEIAYGS